MPKGLRSFGPSDVNHLRDAKHRHEAAKESFYRGKTPPSVQMPSITALVFPVRESRVPFVVGEPGLIRAVAVHNVQFVVA